MTRKTGVQAHSAGPHRLATRASAKAGIKVKARCKAETKSGNACPVAPVHGTKYCVLHTKGNAEKYGQRGGHRRAIFNPENLAQFEAPRSLDEVITVVGQLATETHQGRCDPRVAQVVGTLMTTLLNALEVREFGQKLKDLAREVGINDPLDLLEEARGAPIQ